MSDLRNPSHTLSFLVPLEEPAASIAQLVGRAWPEGTAEQVAALFDAGRVGVDGELYRKAHVTPPENARVVVEVGPGEEVYGLPDAEDLARGEGWVVVNKPTGMPGRIEPDDPMDPVLFLADMLGLDRATFSPVWPMPTEAGGPWLFGLTAADADRLRAAVTSGALMTTWTAIIPRPLMPSGRWESSAPKSGSGAAAPNLQVDYATTTTRGGLCEVQLQVRFGPSKPGAPAEFAIVDALLDLLAEAGHPALGDRTRGGYMVSGGLRLRLAALYQEDSDLAHSWPMPADWWPEGPVAPVPEPFRKAPAAPAPDEAGEAEESYGPIASLTVSSKTLEIVERWGTDGGHPWVLADAKTSGREHLRAGQLVELRGPRGEHGPFALYEGPGDLVARVWSREREEAENFGEEIDIRVDEAIARRNELLRRADHTNVFRLIHGEADGLPGLYLDRMGPVLRATLEGHTALGFKDRVYRSVVAHDPQTMILEVEHLHDVREGEGLPQARVVHRGGGYLKPGEHVVVLEEGLRYRCEPWEGIDVGFFADQRENRRRLRTIVRDAGRRTKRTQRWLNLFCHTGAFSVALAAEGAHVVSVDLSRRYLRWLEENFALNGLDLSLNESVAADCRDYLAQSDARFDGIIVDPPTAASGAGAFWSVRRDYENLLTTCFERLAPGGVMLVCRNDRKRTPTLQSVVERAATRARWKVGSIEPAPPAADYPRVRGFPEGESFEGLLVR